MPLLLRPIIAIGSKPLICARLSGTKSSGLISLLATSSCSRVDEKELSKLGVPKVPSTDLTLDIAPKGIGSVDDNGL